MSEDPTFDARITIGRRTYGYGPHNFTLYQPESRVEVGAFCSIATEAMIISGGEHVLRRATTFPLNYFVYAPEGGTSADAMPHEATQVGSDVWLGQRSMVLSGVRVGDGAVIGAGAIVRRAVPPYAIVTGNPGRVERYRFDPLTCARLLAIRWWEWDDAQVMAHRDAFLGDVTTFLEVAERVRQPPGPSELSRAILDLPQRLLTPPLARSRRSRRSRPGRFPHRATPAHVRRMRAAAQSRSPSRIHRILGRVRMAVGRSGIAG